ncbi:MAG: GNAT family N-acetyltransferase [Chitinophagales bacterium]|jgi:ribosomal protein S18 acetylase RimI-like enzyme|nr:GNAT family N-acetyltransferase [Chitinophagales bacterium]
MNPLIRKAEASDLSALVQLMRNTFEATYAYANTAEDMQDYLDTHFRTEIIAQELNTDFPCFVLETETGLVGYLMMGPSELETPFEGAVELKRIYLAHAAKGKGWGKALLQQGIDWASSNGYKGISLCVWQQNTAAIAFYQSQGFQVVEERKFILGKDVQDDFGMLLKF